MKLTGDLFSIFLHLLMPSHECRFAGPKQRPGWTKIDHIHFFHHLFPGQGQLAMSLWFIQYNLLFADLGNKEWNRHGRRIRSASCDILMQVHYCPNRNTVAGHNLPPYLQNSCCAILFQILRGNLASRMFHVYSGKPLEVWESIR